MHLVFQFWTRILRTTVLSHLHLINAKRTRLKRDQKKSEGYREASLKLIVTTSTWELQQAALVMYCGPLVVTIRCSTFSVKYKIHLIPIIHEDYSSFPSVLSV